MKGPLQSMDDKLYSSHNFLMYFFDLSFFLSPLQFSVYSCFAKVEILRNQNKHVFAKETSKNIILNGELEPCHLYQNKAWDSKCRSPYELFPRLAPHIGIHLLLLHAAPDFSVGRKEETLVTRLGPRLVISVMMAAMSLPLQE